MRRNVYHLAWALLLFVFVIRTAPGFYRDIRSQKMLPVSPSASIDRFLEALLRIPQPSERLNQIFAQLLPDCRIIFVSSKNDERWDFVYSAICYLTWPRKIDKVELDPNEKFRGVANEHTAVIFCGMPSPISAGDRWVVGPNLILLGPVTSP